MGRDDKGFTRDQLSGDSMNPMDGRGKFSGTVLGEDVELTGTIKFKDSLRIDGNLKGDIISEGSLIVGKNALVKANLEIGNIVVEGRVEGNIICKGKIELRSTATITGDIKAAKLMVEEGVVLSGNFEISKELTIPNSKGQKSVDTKRENNIAIKEVH